MFNNKGVIFLIVAVQLYTLYTLHHQLKLAQTQLASFEAKNKVNETA